MTKYYIGIDGGGTKTKTTALDPSGAVVYEHVTTTSYYRQIGVDGVVALLKEELAPAIDDAGPEGVLVGFGMPGYGDDMEADAVAANEIAVKMAPVRMTFKNDVAVGWAGALAHRPGVCVVGGTGSMSYGMDRTGKSARSGGWDHNYSDEGSGYWLGRRALTLFSHECDGRAEKGALYELFHEHFGMTDDEKIIGVINREIVPTRKETAGMQMLLLKAARAGEKEAIAVYEDAVHELARIAFGTVNQLKFSERPILTSYIGGLFNIEDLILDPFRVVIGQFYDAEVIAPLLSAGEGAVLFAIDQYEPQEMERMRSALIARHYT